MTKEEAVSLYDTNQQLDSEMLAQLYYSLRDFDDYFIDEPIKKLDDGVVLFRAIFKVNTRLFAIEHYKIKIPNGWEDVFTQLYEVEIRTKIIYNKVRNND